MTWIERAGLRIRAQALPRLEALGLTSVAAAQACALGEPLPQRRPERSHRWLEEGQSLLKRAHYGRLSVWLRASAKLNFPNLSGRAELAILEALEAAGLRAPRGLAAGDGGGLWRGQSFVWMERLPGEPLDALDRGQREALLPALGAFIAAFHGAGFIHKDLYPCHLFWDEADGFGLIDAERVLRFEGRPPLRWLAKDLAAASQGLSEAQEEALLGAWAAATGWDAAPLRPAIARRRGRGM